MNLEKEDAKLILDLYKQLDGLKTSQDVYNIRIPLIQTYALRKKLEEFVGD